MRAFARSAGTAVLLQQLLCVGASFRGDGAPGEHSRKLFDAVVRPESIDVGADARLVALFHDPVVSVGECGDLRQMGHAQHLPLSGEDLHQSTDRRRHG
ncbi:MAG: hypothetical protein M3Z31_03160, partial [Pseudomonadota bacterium]|nr:hypothetical protein [Pseudomonadota bacterium]